MKRFIAITLFLFMCLSSIGQVASDYWAVKGNISTNPAVNFVGTADNVGLSFRTNNATRADISNTGLFTIPKPATTVCYFNSITIPSTSGIFITTTPIVGTLNITPLTEKGRCATIVNYSSAAITVSHAILVGLGTSVTTIPAGQRWAIIYNGTNFVRYQ